MLPSKLDALAKIENIDISHNPLMKPLEIVAADNLIDPIGRYLSRAELRSGMYFISYKFYIIISLNENN